MSLSMAVCKTASRTSRLVFWFWVLCAARAASPRPPSFRVFPRPSRCWGVCTIEASYESASRVHSRRISCHLRPSAFKPTTAESQEWLRVFERLASSTGGRLAPCPVSSRLIVPCHAMPTDPSPGTQGTGGRKQRRQNTSVPTPAYYCTYMRRRQVDQHRTETDGPAGTAVQTRQMNG
ncbi:hypothetical protein EDB80DRAFT_813312 [Ilyonectria destructans]|nr:hypothetical protein EDB80DRAFT_813312 [Ilyonectria destructans]